LSSLKYNMERRVELFVLDCMSGFCWCDFISCCITLFCLIYQICVLRLFCICLIAICRCLLPICELQTVSFSIDFYFVLPIMKRWSCTWFVFFWSQYWVQAAYLLPAVTAELSLFAWHLECCVELCIFDSPSCFVYLVTSCTKLHLAHFVAILGVCTSCMSSFCGQLLTFVIYYPTFIEAALPSFVVSFGFPWICFESFASFVFVSWSVLSYLIWMYSFVCSLFVYL